MINYKIFNLFPEYGTNTYLFWETESNEGILFDPADKSKQLANFINQQNITLKYIINTHGHLDHIGGDDFFREKFHVPLLIHKADADMLTDPAKNLSIHTEKIIKVALAERFIDETVTDIFLGNYRLTFIHTPGHTQGSVSILIDNYLVSGDTLFYESIGRTDLPGGNYEQIIDSIKNKLFKLPDNTIILPGHGADSTIENEKVGNPFVGILSEL